MLLTLVKRMFHRSGATPVESRRASSGVPLRLHIGGEQAHPDWKILNIQPGPGVDFVGSCDDLSAFADSTVAEIYASHVLEHLGYQSALPHALAEMRRALVPCAALRVSVPDLAVLAELLVDPSTSLQESVHVMRMMFGGQMDENDFHHVGFSFEILAAFLRDAGFEAIERVEGFNLFDDTSTLVFRDRPISLNVQARKPAVNRTEV